VGVWTGPSLLRIGTGTALGNEPSGSLKFGEFLDYLDSAPDVADGVSKFGGILLIPI
jgi:hypothetical protein